MIIFPQRSNAFKTATTGQVTAKRFVRASSQRCTGAAVATAVPLTLAAWARATSTANNVTVLGVFKTAATTNGFYLAFTATNLYPQAITVTNGGYKIAQSATGLSVDTWYHIAGVFSSATSRKVYLNGVEVGSDTVSSTPLGIDNTTIGSFYANSSPQYSDVDIAAAGAWGAALTGAQIAELATGVREDSSSAGTPLAGWRQREDGLLVPYCGTAPQTLTAYNSPTEVSDGPVLYL